MKINFPERISNYDIKCSLAKFLIHNLKTFLSCMSRIYVVSRVGLRSCVRACWSEEMLNGGEMEF